MTTHTWTAPNGVTIHSEVPQHRAGHDRFAITHLAWSYQHTARRVIDDYRSTRGTRCTHRKASS